MVNARIGHSLSRTIGSIGGRGKFAVYVSAQFPNDSVSVNGSPLTVTEGSTATYTVVLGTQPSSEVTITVMKKEGGDADLTLSGGSALTFTTANWNTSQSLTVTAAEDNGDSASGSAVFTHSARSVDVGYNGNNITIPELTAKEDDNDTPGVTVTSSPLTVSEGSTATYTLKLNAQPSSVVTITVTKVSGGDSDLTLTGSSALTFTGSNWDTAQTLTVSAAEDDDAVHSQATFAHSASSGDSRYNGANVTITELVANEVDNDTPGVTVTGSPLSVIEGSSAIYTLELKSQPSADVTVFTRKRPGGDSDLTIKTGHSLVFFTTANWNTAQAIRITAAEDSDISNGQAVFFHQVDSIDDKLYRLERGLKVADVTANEVDNDTPGATVTGSPLSVNEGSTATYSLVLKNVQPSSAVTITVTKVSGGDSDLTLTGSSALTFTTANWDTAQTLTVTAAEDNSDSADGNATFGHSASSGDSRYNGASVTIANLVATEVDNDTPGVTVTGSPLSVNEGSTATYSLKLKAQPSSAVTITVTKVSGGDSDLTLTGSSALTFTTANWNTSQSLTITAAEDNADSADGSATFGHSASSGDSRYDGVTITDLVANEVDNDTPGVTVTGSPLSVNEGSTATYSLKLKAQPSSAVTITVTKVAGGDGDLTLTGSSALTFTTANWNTSQSLTITAAEDNSDSADGSATFGHSASSGDSRYDGVTITELVANEVDNDTPGVTVTGSPLSVNEGSTATYSLKLKAQPSSAVTITVTKVSGGDSDLTLTGSSALTFTTANWNTTQSVTITATEDNSDSADGSATFGHSASSGDSRYNGASVTIANLVANEVDNDTPGVTVTGSPLSVNEGSTATYSLKLKAQPSSAVTITVTKVTGGDADLTLTGSSALTFTTANWNTSQSLTVTAAEDNSDSADGSATFGHSASSGDSRYDGVTITELVATEVDNDTPGVTVTGSPLSVNEGSTATYSLKLKAQPSSAVTITVTKVTGGDADLTLTGSSALTFTTANWNTSQSLTVTAAEDNADSTAGSATFGHSASSGDSRYDGVTITELVANEVDNDTPGVTVTGSPLSVREGSTATYSLKLKAQPSSAVTVTVTKVTGGDADLTLTGSSALTFTTANWNTTQSVTISAAEDNSDSADGSATFGHSASSSDSRYDGANVTITELVATEVDNDTPGVTVTGSPLSVNEGSTATYSLKLKAQPSSAVTITVTKVAGGDSDLTLTGSSALTFTTANWNTSQSLTVTAAEDNGDSVDGSATFGHSASSGDSRYDGVTITELVANEVDNDTPGVTVTGSPLSVNEGSTATYSLKLKAQPSSAVTITVTKVTGGDADLTLTGSSALTFTTANWNTSQSLTVTAAEDNGDSVDGSATFGHSASSGDSRYDGASVTIANLVANEVDNDTPGVTVTGSPLSVNEGSTATYSLKLKAQPSSAVTITVTKVTGGDADLTLTGSSALTFTTANWNTSQSLTVTAAEDNGDSTAGSATFGHSASSGDSRYDGASVTIANLVATEVDNDTPGVTVTGSPLSVNEGSTATYSLKLKAQPSSAVTITVTKVSGGDSDLTLTGSSALTFTTANWNTSQSVTISAAEDNGDSTAGSATFGHSASSGDSRYDGVTITELVANEVDNDTPGVTVTGSPLSVREGSTATYSLKLKAQPSSAVTITVTKASGGDSDLTLTGSSALTFTTANWNTSQSLTVTAAEDNADSTAGSATFGHSASSSDSRYDGANVTIANLVATEVDNDTPGVTVTGSPLSVNEGSTATYSLKLKAQPSSAVTITVTKVSGGDSDLTLTGSSALTFTTANWNTTQSLTVTAAEDNSDSADGSATFGHSASSSDSRYNGASVTIANLVANEVDNDTPGVTVATSPLSVNEGSTATYSLKLKAQPSSAVTITVTKVTGGDGDLTLTGSSTLTFTTANWNTTQSLTVTAAEDNSDSADGSATFDHSASSSDSRYDGASVTIANLVATEVDNDTPGVTVTGSPLSVNEGSTATYSLKLKAQPSSAVTITVTKVTGGDGDLTLTGSSALTFTTANWNTSQNVTITAAEDNSDSADGSATFGHSASSGDSRYDGANVTITELVANEVDNDTPGVTVTGSPLSVNEGSTATYSLKLKAQPSSAVTITVTKVTGGDSDLTLTGSSALTFTTANWNTSQSLTVTAAEDNADSTAGSATFGHSASSGDSRYDGVTITELVANEVDNDTPGVTVTGSPLSVREGSTATYSLKLKAQPSSAVTVTVTKVAGGDSDLTLTGSSALTFTTANWNTTQSVTITAAEDNADSTAGSATFGHSASSGDSRYDGVTITELVANEVDNDTPGVTVATSPLSVNEGSTATYSLKLKAQPSSAVTITVTKVSGGDSDLTLTGSSALTFTTANWNTTQSVTISAAEDNADSTAGSATFGHSASSSDSRYNGASVTITDLVANEVDNDTPGVTVTGSPLSVNEGSTATYSLKLKAQPSSAVTITVTKVSGGDSDLTLTGSSALTFTTANWNTSQSVTISAAEDNGDSTAGSATFGHSASSGDSRYDGANVTIANLVATEVDNDTPGVTVTGSPLSVNEGSTATYSLKLKAQPSSAVTITVTKVTGGDADLTLTGSSALTFTTANWNTSQSLTVTAAEDNADSTAGSATFGHSASSGDSRYDGASVTIANLVATEVDNDTPGVTVTGSPLSVNEGSTATYSLKLKAQPSSAVTITVTKVTGGDSDLTLTGSSALTFTTANWNTSQSLTVTAAEDNGDSVDGSATFGHSASSGDSRYDGASVTIANLVATEVDNDTPGVTVTGSPLSVNEGSTATYSLKLKAQPSSAVTITVTKVTGGDADLTLTGSSALTFTTANWNTSQSLTVTAAEDNGDSTAGSATFGHSASSGDSRYDGVTITELVATEVDNDTPGVTVTGSPLSVNEGSTATYSLKLKAQPSSAVTITVTKVTGGDADLTLTGSSAVTFTTANWNTSQSLTVTAAEDNGDSVDGSATFGHSASSGDSRYDGASVTITELVANEVDNDTPGVTVTGSPLSVNEGSTATYSLKLKAQPSSAVTITVTKVTGGDSDLTLTGSSALTFTTANWNTSQSLTVTAAEDNGDSTAGSATFGHSASSGDSRYDGASVTITELVANEVDNDTPGVTVTGSPLSVNEGSTATYSLKLKAQPSSAVTITVTKVTGGDADLTLTGSSALTFTTANWNTSQSLTVTAAEDNGDSTAGSATFGHSASSGDSRYDGVTITELVATEVDNDTPGVTVTGSPLSVNEGSTATYSLKLKAQPSSAVTITVTKVTGGDADLTLTGSSALTFTTANWDTSQSLTVTAAEDNGDSVDGSATFGHSASSGDSRYDGANVTIANLVANEVDNDTPGVTVTGSPLSVNEGSTATYSLKLKAQPSSAVTITVTKVTGGDADLTLTGSSALTFTTANWDTSQSLTVTAAEDNGDSVDGSATFGHSASSGDSRYDGVTIANLVATEVDNDTPGVTVTGSPLSVNEGSTATYSLKLKAQPSSAVTVTVTKVSGGDSDLTLTGSSTLTFTTANWNTSQSLTVTAAEDNADSTAGSATFGHSASSGDSRYDGVTITELVANEVDNDTPGVTVTGSPLSVNEGSTATYSLKLKAQPSSAVTITVTKVTGGDSDLTLTGSSALTFTTANWNTSQSLTVTAAEDNADSTAGSATFGHSASSGDSRYDGVTITELVANEVDNDTPGVTVTGSPLSVNEGSTATYSLKLKAQPSSAVTITVTKVTGGDADLTLTGSSALTFTTANWNTTQSLTVTAAEDNSDSADGSATFGHSASSSDSRYNGASVTIANLVANEVDNDTPGVTVATSPLSVNEGSTATYSLKLKAQPSSAVTITVRRLAGEIVI